LWPGADRGERKGCLRWLPQRQESLIPGECRTVTKAHDQLLPSFNTATVLVWLPNEASGMAFAKSAHLCVLFEPAQPQDWWCEKVSVPAKFEEGIFFSNRCAVQFRIG